MPRSRRPKPSDFGPLYHGTSVPHLSEIDQSIGGRLYAGMPGTLGYNYVTTDFGQAQNYADDAARIDRQKGGKGVQSVYEVTPRVTYSDDEGNRHRYEWGVDEHSGPSGWFDNEDTIPEALERAEMGNEVSLKFRSPLKAREIWSQDKSIDLTVSHHVPNHLRHEVPYRFEGSSKPRSAAFVLGKETGRPYPYDISISFE